jgi:hypothetical protein
VIGADARNEVVGSIDRTVDGVEFTTHEEFSAKG